MKKPPIFKNQEMTELLDRYSKHPGSKKLRDEIMAKTLPLVSAAIARKRLYLYRDDLLQEAALKVLTALPKYDRKRGTAFEFLWSTICNNLITHGKRLSKSDLSLDTEEGARREAEVSQPIRILSPEKDFIRELLLKALTERNGSYLRTFHKEREKSAVDFLTSAALNGDLFSERSKVLRKLRRLGIKKKDCQFFLDYILVALRAKLYSQRELADELASRQVGQVISKVIDS